MSTLEQRLAYTFRSNYDGFARQWERDARLKALGATPKDAFTVWALRRHGALPKPTRRAAPATSHRAPASPAPPPRPTPRPAAPYAWRYRTGARCVVRDAPGWPIFQCQRPTDTAPGTSDAWHLVGRAG